MTGWGATGRWDKEGAVAVGLAGAGWKTRTICMGPLETRLWVGGCAGVGLRVVGVAVTLTRMLSWETRGNIPLRRTSRCA